MTYTVPDTSSAFGFNIASRAVRIGPSSLCSSTCQEHDAVAISEDASDNAALVLPDLPIRLLHPLPCTASRINHVGRSLLDA